VSIDAPPHADVRACVLLNARAGTAERVGLAPDSLKRRFADAGAAVEIETVSSEALSDRARRAAEAGLPMVVAAGGDGTIGAVAAALAGTRTALGILPLGTRNHFARDLHIPGDLGQAVQVIAAGHTRAVDVGEVNGCVFVNNASIGLYPEIVEGREVDRRDGWTKDLATLRAGWRALRRFRVLRVRLSAQGSWDLHTTPFVVVGNNEYTMSLLALGTRACLDGGTLSVYTANVHRPLAFLRTLLFVVAGRLDQARDFEQRCVPEAWLASRWRRLRVALDGEIVSLAPPLHFRVRPAALRVVVPSP
jgi:diacylglycerol kinase family enzyme